MVTDGMVKFILWINQEIYDTQKAYREADRPSAKRSIMSKLITLRTVRNMLNKCLGGVAE